MSQKWCTHESQANATPLSLQAVVDAIKELNDYSDRAVSMYEVFEAPVTSLLKTFGTLTSVELQTLELAAQTHLTRAEKVLAEYKTKLDSVNLADITALLTASGVSSTPEQTVEQQVQGNFDQFIENYESTLKGLEDLKCIFEEGKGTGNEGWAALKGKLEFYED
jgi:hypothetical protein